MNTTISPIRGNRALAPLETISKTILQDEDQYLPTITKSSSKNDQAEFLRKMNEMRITNKRKVIKFKNMR